jgi:hypothetical protein
MGGAGLKSKKPETGNLKPEDNINLSQVLAWVSDFRFQVSGFRFPLP